MADFKKIYLYRMTHMDNMSDVLVHGITHRNSENSNPAFTPIGDGSLIHSRDSFVLKNRRLLGEYIPFYFGTRMPMLYVIQNGYNGVYTIPSEQIVYCVSSVQEILDLGLDFIFTDGHAVDSFSDQYTIHDIGNIDSILDFTAIKAKYWKSEIDLDLKRRKEAEFLISQDIPLSAILGYIVINDNAKNKLMEMGIPDTQIHISKTSYF